VIVGGTAVVSAGVEASLEGLLGSTHVLRLAGSSRYETSKQFAVWATGKNTGETDVGTTGSPAALRSLDFNRVGIASGENFPDALAGGVFCGLSRSPILLTPSARVSPYIFADYERDDSVPSGADYLGSSNLAIVRSYAFGGTAAITQDVVLSLDVITGPIPY
jgi:N-acetylmuramoyl-L-alanine amidase